MQFHFAKIPEIIFQSGAVIKLPEIIQKFGSDVLIILDPLSVQSSGLFSDLRAESINFKLHEVSGEPSPERIDTIVREYKGQNIDSIVGVGGGSVVDTGKAVAAMFGKEESVFDYLEGVGNKIHDGSKVPFIAVPTTAGTGSEATKNAVLSKVGEKGYKKSIRHNNFVPDFALIDPELSLTCPVSVTAACGMDAFTQLLESYTSNNASPMTDALAYDGLRIMKDHLVNAVTQGSTDLKAREAMSYAALISGITLANAGLGIVHGLASPMGGYSDIPHGVACGTLIGSATRINIDRLREEGESGQIYLKKYAAIGGLFSNDKYDDPNESCEFLVEKIESWIDTLGIPRLNKYGYDDALIEKIIDGTGNKNNPINLSNLDIRHILEARI